MKTLKVKDWKRIGFTILLRKRLDILRVVRKKDEYIFYRGGFYYIPERPYLVEISSFSHDLNHVWVNVSSYEMMVVHINSLSKLGEKNS